MGGLCNFVSLELTLRRISNIYVQLMCPFFHKRVHVRPWEKHKNPHVDTCMLHMCTHIYIYLFIYFFTCIYIKTHECTDVSLASNDMEGAAIGSKL